MKKQICLTRQTDILARRRNLQMEHVKTGAVLLILLLVIVAAAVEIYRETHQFRVTRYDVTSKKLSGIARKLHILFLSDLHNCVYGKENDSLIQSIRDEKPDLILIGGDMLVGKEGASCDQVREFTEKLPGICPVIYVNGNHEQRLKESTEIYGNMYADYKCSLEKSGVHFLENESIRVELGDRNLVICGLELPVSSYRKFSKEPVSSSDITECFGFPASESDYTILLAHNPAYMDAYLAWGADLILSGHLHGGLVRVPGLGGIITPQGFLFPKYSGEMTREGDQTVIVSRGLGTHTLNIRLFNIPELISIRLGE